MEPDTDLTLDVSGMVQDGLTQIVTGLQDNLPIALGIGLGVFALFYVIGNSKRAVKKGS
jgi:hypothetical protein